MLFISEKGERFGMYAGERAELRVHVEKVPKVPYKMREDDALRLKIMKKGPCGWKTAAEISGSAGSGVIPIDPKDTMDLKPGAYTAVIMLDSPSLGCVGKPIWPAICESEIEAMDPHFPRDNMLLMKGCGAP